MPQFSTWSQVWNELKRSGWKSGAVVILTKWIRELQPVNVPKYLLLNKDSLTPSCIHTLVSLRGKHLGYMIKNRISNSEISGSRVDFGTDIMCYLVSGKDTFKAIFTRRSNQV